MTITPEVFNCSSEDLVLLCNKQLIVRKVLVYLKSSFVVNVLYTSRVEVYYDFPNKQLFIRKVIARLKSSFIVNVCTPLMNVIVDLMNCLLGKSCFTSQVVSL